MKKLRFSILKHINLLLASAIAALGFIGCSHQKNAAKQKAENQDDPQSPEIEEISAVDDQQLICMYGVPRAQYIVKGVVENKKGQPVRMKQVAIQVAHDEVHVMTDENGMFELQFDGFPADQLTFEIDDKRYVEPVVYDSEPEDKWNRGTATMKVHITHVTPQEINQQNPPIMLKYGVPPTRLEK